MTDIKLLSALCIFIITVISGSYPFLKKRLRNQVTDFPIAESVAAGVFLAVSLIHMLGDASAHFYALSYRYPLAFLLAGGMFLFLLWLEHVGREVNVHEGDGSHAFALLATGMLSIHALLMGAALGLTQTNSVMAIVFFAIIAHKWAESLALSIQINKSHFSFKSGVLLYGVFALMTPMGVVLGGGLLTWAHNLPILLPVVNALAAGTFLYLGTLHGLEKATLVKPCCDLKRFYFVILGFGVMAVAAIWM